MSDIFTDQIMKNDCINLSGIANTACLVKPLPMAKSTQL